MKLLRTLGFAFTTILIYLGVPLLGWGVLDLSGFFSVAPRAGYALVVGALGLLVGYQAIRAPEGFRGNRGDEEKRVRRQGVVSAAMIAVLYLGLFGLPFADRREIGVLAIGLAGRWAGLVLATLGLGLIFWSGVALGRMYSKQVTIQADHKLVLLRPSLSAILSFLAQSPIFWNNPCCLPAAILSRTGSCAIIVHVLSCAFGSVFCRRGS